jgi:hypothetical protein
VFTPPARAPTQIALPPNLCAATDNARDTADAYMGSLSAGQLTEALNCVYPGAVPLPVTTSLIAHQANTAVYLPMGQSTAPVFTYQGNGKTIHVTVTREHDGKTWVTDVQVN